MGQDLVTPRPELGHWVAVRVEGARAGPRVVLVNRLEGTAMRLTPEELARCRGTDRTTDAHDAELLHELYTRGFLVDRPPELDQESALPTLSTLRRFLTTLDISWRGADPFVRRLYRLGLARLFSLRIVVLQALLALAGIIGLTEILRDDRSWRWQVDARDIPLLLAVNLIAIAVHELSHALVVVRYGRAITSMGFRLHLGAPAFYVDAPQALLLTRRQRMIQAAAGPWAEWLVTSAVILVVWGRLTGGAGPLLTRFVVVNSVVVACNLLPFCGLDGSWILSDALREPDLAGESRRAFARLVAGARRTTRDVALAGYALANAGVWAAFVVASGLAWCALFGHGVAHLLEGGATGQLALVVVAVLLLGPFVRTLAPGVWPALTGAGSRLRFRAERGWRVRATELLQAHPTLQHLPDLSLGVVAGALSARRLGPLRRGITVSSAGLVVAARGRVTLQGNTGPEEIHGPVTVRPGQRLTRTTRWARTAFLDSAAIAYANELCAVSGR